MQWSRRAPHRFPSLPQVGDVEVDADNPERVPGIVGNHASKAGEPAAGAVRCAPDAELQPQRPGPRGLERQFRICDGCPVSSGSTS